MTTVGAYVLHCINPPYIDLYAVRFLNRGLGIVVSFPAASVNCVDDRGGVTFRRSPVSLLSSTPAFGTKRHVSVSSLASHISSFPVAAIMAGVAGNAPELILANSHAPNPSDSHPTPTQPTQLPQPTHAPSFHISTFLNPPPCISHTTPKPPSHPFPYFPNDPQSITAEHNDKQ